MCISRSSSEPDFSNVSACLQALNTNSRGWSFSEATELCSSSSCHWNAAVACALEAKQSFSYNHSEAIELCGGMQQPTPPLPLNFDKRLECARNAYALSKSMGKQAPTTSSVVRLCSLSSSTRLTGVCIAQVYSGFINGKCRMHYLHAI